MIIEIKQFNGGISDDVRQQSDGIFALSKHFNIYTNPNTLVPYIDQEQDISITGTTGTAVTNAFKNLAYNGTTLYAIGQQGGTDKIRLYEKGASDIVAGNWAISNTSTQTGSGAPLRASFKPYKNYLWGLKGSSSGAANKAEVWNYGSLASGVKSLTESFSAANALTIDDTTLSRVAEPHLGIDDNLYLPYENKVAKIVPNGASFVLTAARLTLPSTHTITGTAPYGNYVAFATKPVNQWSSVSKVFIWDYIADDVIEVIDWGDGDLVAIQNIDGFLIGLTEFTGIAVASSVIKAWSGGAPQLIKRLPFNVGNSDRNTNVPSGKYQGRMYFPLTENSNKSLWSVGRTNQNYPWAITSSYLLNGAVNVSTVESILFVGDFLFSTHDSGKVSKRNDAGTYAFTSLYITQKLNMGDMTKNKRLNGLAAAYESLPSGGSISVDYRANSNCSTTDYGANWTELFTDSALNSVSHECRSVEGTNGALPEFKEIQFRIRSTGGAKPTGLKIDATPFGTLLT